MANTTPAENVAVSFIGRPDAPNGLALVRITIGAMFVWVFFENLGKGGYTPAGYAGVINYYIKSSHSPAAWGRPGSTASRSILIVVQRCARNADAGSVIPKAPSRSVRRPGR